jgi:hypothetical protein
MREAQYPVDLGTRQELNDKGEALVTFQTESTKNKYSLDPNDKSTLSWKTYRDYENGDRFYSIFTGTKAVPLKRTWIDIDDSNMEEIIGPPRSPESIL